MRLRSVVILTLTLVCALGFGQVTVGRMRAPIVILCTGQSNFVHRTTLKWMPAKNVLSWNYDGIDGHVGTAFVPVRGSGINLAEKIASDIATANPERPVYVIGVAIGSQSIAQWLPGASAPDMYANIAANVVRALAAIGTSKIDALYWYQGETRTASPELYVDHFNAVMDRFKMESWFPHATPVVVYAIAPTSISGSVATDATNAALRAAVRADPAVRRMVDTDSLDRSFWRDTVHPNGPGFFALGTMGADAYLRGTGSPSAGRIPPASGNLLRLENMFGVSARPGIFDLAKSGKGPTIAQTGISTNIHTVAPDTELASPTYYGVMATISGVDSGFLGFGRANAKPVVISFQVKATVTGDYFVTVENDTGDRSYTSPYKITAANAWEKKWVVIPGDTTGNWQNAAGAGLRVFWTIASSDKYLFTPDVWNAGDVRVGSVTRANGMSGAGNHFQLEKMKIEEGVYPSDDDREPATIAYDGTEPLKVPVAATKMVP